MDLEGFLIPLLSRLGLPAIDHVINSAAKSNYMSAGQINVPIVFRGPNGPAAGVGAQHSQVCLFFIDSLTIFS
uniref:Pyruvate dehydrogenase E1 component subunit beta n=1 Tax=Helianthus annuus TaxID=4232 RepID=A0A251RS10_HELAN